LEVTENEKDAEYVKINKIKYKGANVTEKRIYEVKRKFYSDNYLVEFLNGEAYIVNDVGKEFFGVFNTCEVVMYKNK
jgi:hypothetical protein